MAQTKMILRIVSDQRRRQFQQQQAAVAPPQLPAPLRVCRQRARAGVKNIEGRIHSKRFKIKRLIAVPKNVEAKKEWISCSRNDST